MRLPERLGGLSRPAKLFVVILAVALLVRIVAVGATRDYALVTDSADYHRHAVSISNGDGFPDTVLAPGGGPSAFRPPLYPYFMGGIYAVAGPKWNAVRIVQAFVGVVTVALIGLIGLQLWDRRTALVAAGIAAVYPPFVISGAAILGDVLFLPLELGAVAAMIQHRRDGSGYRWIVVAGVLAGLATLARSNGIVLLLPLLLACWPGRAALSRRWLLQPAALVAAALLVIAPWTIRNASELDSLVPVSTQSGFALAGTYNETSREDPTFPAGWQAPNRLADFSDVFDDPDLSELEMDRQLRSRAFDYIADNPLYLAEVGALNTLRTFNLTGLDIAEEVSSANGISAGVADVGAIGFWIVGLFALAGAFTRAARMAPLFFWLTPVVFLFSIVFIADSAGRYRLALEPFVILLAALGLIAAWQRWRPRTISDHG